jgi:SAM-dependent methyltransferase
MRMFLRKSTVGRDPLVLAMSGVRMGERLLQIGVDDPAELGALAAKVGISGHSAVATLDERTAGRARAGIADAGALADVTVAASGDLPYEGNTFDVVIVHGANGLLASLSPEVRARLLSQLRQVTRPGGRVVLTEPGERSGLKAMLAPSAKRDERYEQGGGTIVALQDAGFRPVRLLADREGIRFIEGLKPA